MSGRVISVFSSAGENLMDKGKPDKPDRDIEIEKSLLQTDQSYLARCGQAINPSISSPQRASFRWFTHLFPEWVFLLCAILFGVFPLRFVLSPIDAWFPFRPIVSLCVPLIDACSRLMCVPT